MSGYTKLFSDIVDSSIWQEPADIKVVWVTMLALADQNGCIRGSPGWLASKARVPVDRVEAALKLFQQPDPSSRTTDNDGRRIESLPDGWLILNYLSFRDRMSNDHVAAQTRERVRKHRERYSALRNASNVTRAASVYASVSAPDILPERIRTPEVLTVWREWVAYRLTRARSKEPEKMFRYQADMIAAWGPEGAIASMRSSIANGYQGLFPPRNTPQPPRRRDPNI